MSNIFEVLESVKPEFDLALSNDYVTWNKEFQFAKQLLQKSSSLNAAAWSNQESFRNAIINVAAMGITLNPDLGHAYLVPRKGIICLDVGYKGLIHLARKAKSVEWVQAKMVYKKDTYKNLGTNKEPLHDYEAFGGDRGNIVGAYCLAKLHTGDYHVEELDSAMLARIESMSKATTGPWKQWREAMCKKSCVKSAANYWNLDEITAKAIAFDNEQFGNSEPLAKDIGPATNSKTINSLLVDKGADVLVEGLTLEEWVYGSETKEDFELVRNHIRKLANGPEKERLKTLFMTRVQENRGVKK